MTETFCRDCEHLHGDAKRDPWWRWLCTAAPIEVYPNYVNGESTEPYALCKSINRDGACSMFSKGHNILNPKDDGNGPAKA